MIHACKQRKWYINNFLLPSLLQQGIKKDEIMVWMDEEEKGNLTSFLESAGWICFNQDLNDAIWHIQDDVIISDNFKQKTEQLKQEIVCGFCCKNFNARSNETIGLVPAVDMWYSFQCIRISNKILKEFLDWYYNETIPKHIHDNWRAANKFDDSFFHDFICNKKSEMKVINLKPNLVDHIDYLIGGTIINQERTKEINESCYWGYPEKNQELKKAIAEWRRNERLA